MNVIYHHSWSFADPMGPCICNMLLGRQVNALNVYSIGRQPERHEFLGHENPRLDVQTGAGRLTKENLRAIFFRAKSRHQQNRKQSMDALRMEINKPALLTLGSIFQAAGSEDYIWGTGVNPFWQRHVKKFRPPKITALRGPLSRHYLMTNYGWSIPESYGDPGLLISRFIGPDLKKKKKYDFLVLLQHQDEICDAEAYIGPSCNIVRCQRGVGNRLSFLDVAKLILQAHFVLSTSLHGIIFAESLGVSARWIRNPYLLSTVTEPSFKYNDYYLSTEREPYQFARNIKESLNMGGLPIPERRIEELRNNLLSSFPKNIFK